MAQTNPWRLLIIVLAMVAFIASVFYSVSGEGREYVLPLQMASVGLGLLWLVVSAICWEIRRRP